MGNVQSMTGFASAEGERDGFSYEVSARSVNGRSLDVRVRLPSGLERYEGDVRRFVTEAFKRGTVTLALSVSRQELGARWRVNHGQLDAYLAAIAGLGASGEVAAPRADGLLALKGVIEGETEADVAGLAPRLLEVASAVVDDLCRERLAEGARLVPLISEQLDRMDDLREAIDSHPERSVKAIGARIDRQISELVAGAGSLSRERLHQEAVLLATRADVREELDRLAAHIEAARAVLGEGGAVGRKLDFLAQELNREGNTICAKAPHHKVTALGLELKVAVEQMREQVQNLE